MIYFTADWHLYHKNIIRYCNRPFKTVKAMHNRLFSEFNAMVLPDDETYHIGDFTMVGASHKERFKDTVRKINGVQHLILGNHDEMKPFHYIDIGFTSIHTSFPLTYTFEDRVFNFVLNHDPSVYCMLKEDQYLLHGHIHNLYQHLLPARRIVNVGVDVWDFKPVSIEDICRLIVKEEKDGKIYNELEEAGMERVLKEKKCIV